MVLGQYKLVLLGIMWRLVSIGLICLYILEKVDIWTGDTDASHTHSQTTEYSATQLVSSIKFKLSHAMYVLSRLWILGVGCPVSPTFTGDYVGS